MAHYKTMVVFQGESNMAEDRFINTWHHEKVGQLGGNTADMDNIHGLLEAFYTTVHGSHGFAICDRMPADVLTGQIQFRTYQMEDEEPRQPYINTAACTFGAGTPLPTEVAIAMSFHGARSIPRERGRLYLGPLVTTAGQAGPSGKGLVPADTFLTVVRDQCAALVLAQEGFENLYWSVFSPRRLELGLGFSGLTHVQGGWIDNAFDTQRRRGTDATTRAVWGTASVPVP